MRPVCVCLALLGGSLVACASRLEDSAATFIAPGVRFVAPGPESFGGTRAAEQLITAHFRDQTFVFQTRVAISPHSLEIVAFDPFGRRGLTISRHGDETKIETAPWLPAFIKPANILGDMTISFWPAAIVKTALITPGSALDVYPGHRAVLANGQEIIQVDYEPPSAAPFTGVVHFVNRAFGYDLEIQSSEIDQ